MANLAETIELLGRCRQDHLLRFYEELGPSARRELLEQIAWIDWPRLERPIQTHVLSAPTAKVPEDVQPAPIYPDKPADEEMAARYAEARRRGEGLIADGRVAAMVVAGGVGTRLGFDGPKGCLTVTPVRNKPLFQVFAEQILATNRRFGTRVPWLIMTSRSNDAATRQFFADNGFFGLARKDVIFFAQGEMPAIGTDGKVLLAEKGRIAFSPDGHGGSLTALRASGALEELARRGVEYISYFQVDNPLVRCVDPLFIGLTDLDAAQMSAKALPKRDPMEKLGNFCLVDGKVTVIEYSDLPEELAYATRPDGTLKFRFGSIAIHVLSRRFVEELTAGGKCPLPFHRAVKKVPCVDADGRRVEPDEPNAVKLEMFIFDAMPLAERTVVLQTARDEEFSPVKNASGPDSRVTCLHDQVRRAAMWLESTRARVPRDADGMPAVAIEISPLMALDADELAGKLSEGLEVRPNEPLYLE